MRQLHPDLWTVDAPLRFFGVELGARMTVVRLSGGGLLLHSPVAYDAQLAAEVRALGPVVALVAPNRFHHLFVGDWSAAFPDARLFVAPTLDEKRPELLVHGVLSDAPDEAWADVLDQVWIRGFPMTHEVVFFHRASGTLIVTDLAFNIGPSSARLTRWAFRATGAYGRLTPTWLERLGIRDRSAFRASMDRVMAWPFERVIMAHGEVVSSGGRQALYRGYSWLWPVSLTSDGVVRPLAGSKESAS